MKRRASSELFDYWNAVRRGRLAPTTRAFDPTAVRDALREGFYLEADATGVARLAWLGPDLAAGLMSARRDAPFLDLWSAQAETDAHRLLQLAMRPCPVVAGAWGFDADGVSRVLETLLVPLVIDDAAPRASLRLVGVVAGVRPEAPIPVLGALSAFRALDDAPQPWRVRDFGTRRRRDGWSSRFAELTRRAQNELGARAEPGDGAFDPDDAGAPSLRTLRHLTVISGGKSIREALP